MVHVKTYSEKALSLLSQSVSKNEALMTEISKKIVEDVKAGKSLFAFGSGHSGLFPLELYHRAGGCSFLIPIVADYLLPHAGPPIVRVLERSPMVANALLERALPQSGEMIWIMSQSGVNSAVVDFALECKKKNLHTVAFTSIEHSSSVKSRHSSGKRLYEVCDKTIDLGGVRGDALVEVASDLRAGPLSLLSATLMGHSILVAACSELEKQGIACTYTSVNTPEGEQRNKKIELKASLRDPLLRG